MPIIEPDIPTPRESHKMDLWEKEECCRFYIRERRRQCTFRQIMNLWLRAPYCASCAASDPFIYDRPPDIYGRQWRRDISWKLGEDTLRIIKKELRENNNFAIICKKCGNELRPWDEDQVWVVNYHLEEHYGIPLETPGREKPSAKLCGKIIELYNHTCFGCGKSNKDLHIDHIYPKSKGGDAAFRNLQPLCEECGNMKGNNLPEEIEVFLDIYFGPYPSDSYEGLFW